MPKKNAAAAAMEQLQSPQASPALTDEEELSPEEQELMGAGSGAPPEPEPAPAAPEPAPEPEPADEVAQQPEEEVSDEEAAERGSVPYAALHQERKEKRALKERLEAEEKARVEQQAKIDKINERLLAMQERAAAPKPTEGPKPAADPEPNKEVDYTGWLEWQIRQQNTQLTSIAENQRQLAQANEATRGQQTIEGLERQFIAAGHADYYERVNFVRERRDQELQMMGYADPQMRAQMLANDAAMLVQGAIRSGKNPAEVAYELSTRWGYAAAAPAAAAPAPAAPGKPTPQQQIAAQQKRQAAATSVQALRTVPAAAPVSVKDIADMDDDQFEAFMEKNGGDFKTMWKGLDE